MAIQPIHTRIRPVSIRPIVSRSIKPTLEKQVASPQSPHHPPLSIEDRFSKNKPKIQSLNLNPNTDEQGKVTNFSLHLKNGKTLHIPAHRLSRDTLLSRLFTASQTINIATALDIQDSASALIQNLRISARQPSPHSLPPPAAELNFIPLARQEPIRPLPKIKTLNIAPKTPQLSPSGSIETPVFKLEDLLEKKQEQIQNKISQTLDTFQKHIQDTSHPKAKRALNQILLPFLILKESRPPQTPLSFEQGTELLLQRVTQKIMMGLSETGYDTQKSQRLQILANLPQDNPSISAQGLIRTAQNFFPGQRELLEGIPKTIQKEFLDLNLIQSKETIQNLLNTPLSTEGQRFFDILQDTPQSELLSILTGFQELNSDIEGDWRTETQELNQVHQNLNRLRELSPETLALIEKANALAQLELAPKPGAIKGFKDGALSLIQEFLRIFQELDRDVQAIYSQVLKDTLSTRLLSHQFVQNHWENRQFDQGLRTLREAQKKLLEERLDFILQQLEFAVPA